MGTSPSTKSAGAAGSGRGSHRSWFRDIGGACAGSSNRGCSKRWNGWCVTAGRMRYSQERRFACRGAVNAVPENCSAYNPKGQRCGELRPCGSAPGSASLANSLPKPLEYPGSSDWDTIALTARLLKGPAKLPVYNIGAMNREPKAPSMVDVSQAGHAAPMRDDLKGRI